MIPVSALLLGVALLMMGNGLLTTLIGVRLGEAGTGAFAIGLVMSGYFLGLVIGSLGANRMIQQAGHIRAFAALASLFSAASLLHVFIENAMSWWALRVIEGICMAGLYVCAESWLNARADNETRGTILSAYTLTSGIGLGLGQLLLSTYPVSGFALFALSSVLTSLAVLPVALSSSPGPALPEPSRLDLGALWRLSPLGVSGCITSGLLLGGLYGMGPTFGQRLGLDADGIAWFMGAVVVGGMILLSPMGHLSDRIDRRLAMLGNGVGVVVISLCVVAVIILKFGPEAVDAAGRFRTWIGPLAVLFGGLAFTLYPLSLAQANDHAQDEDFVPMAGGLVLSYSVGATFGPIVSSLFLGALGPSGLFVYFGLSGLLLTLLALWRLRTAPRLAEEARVPFQPVPRTSAVVYELDPRHEEHN